MNTQNRCDNCPLVRDMREHIDEHKAEVDDIIAGSVSELPDRLAEEILALGLSLGADPAAAPDCHDLAQNIRKEGGLMLDSTNKHIESLEASLDVLRKGCAGPLGMRAVRDGTEYTSSLCTSPVLPRGTNTELVRVKRTNKQP